MKKKNELTEAVEKADRKFREIKQREEIIAKRIQKEKKEDAPDSRKLKFEEHKRLEAFRLKEKLTYAAIAFCLGHLLLVPLYMRFPEQFLPMFLTASFSLVIIGIAIIDLSP